MALGKRVKGRRLELGMTQEQLAKKIGKGQSYIQSLENRDSKKTSSLFSLSKALQCSTEWLTTGKENDLSQREMEAIYRLENSGRLSPSVLYAPPVISADEHVRNRKKLIHSILFFCENTNVLGKTKLFKLLFFADFETFKQTNSYLTGMPYYAWKFGPVPTRLYEEFDDPEPDLEKAVDFSEVSAGENSMTCVSPTGKVEFNQRLFTLEEMSILHEIANDFKDSRASDMVEASHMTDQPWHQVYEIEGMPQAYIPYEYAIKYGDSQ